MGWIDMTESLRRVAGPSLHEDGAVGHVESGQTRVRYSPHARLATCSCSAAFEWHCSVRSRRSSIAFTPVVWELALGPGGVFYGSYNVCRQCLARAEEDDKEIICLRPDRAGVTQIQAGTPPSGTAYRKSALMRAAQGQPKERVRD